MALRPLAVATCGAMAVYLLGGAAFSFAGNPSTPSGAQRSPSLRAAGAVAAAGTPTQEQPRTTSSVNATAFALTFVGAAISLVASAQRRQARATQRKAFCSGFSSSGSGFHGEPTVSSFSPMPTSTENYSDRQGAASMGMKNQVWWVTSNGFDWKGGGKIFDSRRRESRRRGEELFRHDVDNYELTLNNLIGAPGSRKKKVVRGRGKYGSHGRTCGYGNGGAHKRGRRTINPGYDGGSAPLHIKTPKLSKEQLDSMKTDPYTPLTLAQLNMCEDGEEVEYMDLFVRGLPVRPQRRKYPRIKVKGTDDDEFNVKNLTVYAHAFEPPAREKIEKLGGRCVRLHDWANTPIDLSVNVELPAIGESVGAEEQLVEAEAPASEE